jgi:hypothetical protein
VAACAFGSLFFNLEAAHFGGIVGLETSRNVETCALSGNPLVLNFSRSVLAKVGGIQRFGVYLAEDYFMVGRHTFV